MQTQQSFNDLVTQLSNGLAWMLVTVASLTLTLLISHA